MQKKILSMAFAACLLAACANNKAKENKLLEEVIKYHDKVMGDDGLVMKNKMRLKIIAATHNTTPGVKDSVVMYNKQLDKADDVMMIWMNNFNPDYTGKSHDDVMTYLNTQKTQIVKIDSQMIAAITASNNYIAKLK